MATYTENYALKKPEGIDAPNVEDFNGNADIIDRALGAHANNFADKYDPNSTYTQGRLCIQNNALWKAKQDINVAEAWTPEHWDPTTLAAELSSLNSSLTSLQSQSLIPRDAPKISANDILQSGIYRLNGDITDVNNNNNGILIHLMCGDATNIRLQFICRYDGELCRIRTYWYGTWSAWKEL